MSKCLSLIRERFCDIFSPAVHRIRSDVAEVASSVLPDTFGQVSISLDLTELRNLK